MSPVMEHTSVPPWALEPTARLGGGELPIDPKAAAAIILNYDAEETASRWRSQLEAAAIPHETVPLVPCGRQHGGETFAQEQEVLARCFTAAKIGWRLMIAGPLADVLRARSRALEAGLLDEEILVATTRTDRLPVFCAHCEETTLAAAAIDDVVDCSACGEPLLIYYHVSRRRGAFLGFKVDAEEWAPEEVGGR